MFTHTHTHTQLDCFENLTESKSEPWLRFLFNGGPSRMYPKLYVVTKTVCNVKIMIVGCMHAKLLKPICSKCTNANDEDASYEPHEENQHHMFLPEASMNREKKKKKHHCRQLNSHKCLGQKHLRFGEIHWFRKRL